MYGIGYISRTLGDTLQVGNGLGKLPPMRSAVGNAFVIDYVPLDEIYTDESNFQNRGDKYSEKSVKSIIDAVANGNFNWFAFDPVILWENPADGKKFVLSGHSRTQAFRQLAKMHPDWIVDGLTFTSIPARIYRGSFEDAKRLALNSNTLATPETLTERAAYYRRIRERQGITKGKDLKALKDKALRENNGQMIWDLSYLPEGGISFDSLKAFKLGEESGSTENFLRLATICQWIGKAFQIYQGLSKAHDRELFNFLMSGGYGSKSGQYFNFTSLNDRLQKLYAKNVADSRKVNANGEYTEPFQIAAYKKDDATLDTLDELKKDADGAYKELKRKLKELRDNNATREQIFQVATPYFNGWANALYDWWSLLDRTPKEDTAPSLFGVEVPESYEVWRSVFGVDGLGKPTIKFEFEDNQSLADFLTKTKGTVDYAETVDADTYSNPMTVNNRRKARKAAQQKALTDTPSNYLPPSDGTPSLPPSPTSPKALPPYRNVFPARKYFDKVKALYPDYIAFVKDGDFYISYDDDAKKAHHFLNTNLVKDSNGDTFIAFVDTALPTQVAILNVEGITCVVVDENGNVEIMQPPATNEPPVVKFTPKKPKQKKPEIEFDNIKYITRGMPAIFMDVPKSSITDHWLADWWEFAERKYHYPDDIVTFVQIDEKFNGRFNKKYYQFFFKDRDKNFVMQNVKNPKNVISRDGGYFIVTTLADIERIEDALLDDGNRHLVIIEPHIYDDETLGKPTIKLEFEDNADLMSLFDTDGISGFTVNDKPADIFNCPESALQTQGYKPTYRRLPDYSHLIDTADGRKTLKGYGFDRTTLDELINACKHYPQVARLADHLKDPAGDPLQSAFNVWHWLHTNIRYAYDTPGEEEIRTPARVWADRESGVDCDCLAVMTACLLLNMGLNPKFEIVAFNDEPTFSHIYVNLDGAAIDRVLPVFLARPDHITKTQIMDIPVYQLSGIGGCDALSGVYSSTLAKLQQGTATGEDINDFRKTQVLVTLRGIDDAAYSLAALLMPHVVTIADDGTYYFDSTAMAQLATKLDHDLADLISSNADADTISQWIAAAAKQIDGAASVTSNGGDDTIVVIINPKGATTRVIGQMVKSQTDTLTPLTQTATATDTAAQTYAQSATPAIMQTSAMPGVSPDGDTADDESDSNPWLWIAGIAAAFGIGAAVASNKKKRR